MKATGDRLNTSGISDWEPFFSALLDGTPTLDEHARIETLLANDAAFRAAYFDRLEMHALLAWQLRFKETSGETAQRSPKLPQRSKVRKFAVRIAIAACLGLAALGVLYWASDVSPAAACARLIDVYEKGGDRVYTINAHYARGTLTSDPRPIDPTRAPLPTMDGATLYVGDGGKYVLVRAYANGEALINGGNGRESWSVRGRSTVRLSADPNRFRGDIPGQQHDIPFTDMRSNLEQLARAYDVKNLSPEKLDEQRPTKSYRLQGTLKDPNAPVAKRIEIWYDATSGVIQRMIFDGISPGNWAPTRATLDLIEQSPRPANWYEHESHHEPGRPVERIQERDRRNEKKLRN